MISTASTPLNSDFRGNRLLQGVLAAYGLLWAALAIAPVHRFDWFLENILVLAAAVYLTASYRRLPMSDLSYIYIAVFLALHAYGAHYTYSLTPAGAWLSETFGFARNHFDRIAHFGFGLLLAYPLRELIMRGAGVRGAWSYVLALALCMAMSETYELVEWITAQIVDPQAALAFLGTQGDVFDAQKDTGLAAAGAVVALVLTASLPSRPGPGPVSR